MDIGKITLSEQELFEAVQQWLEIKGLTVQVACVQKGLYHHHKEWEITSVVQAENAIRSQSAPASPGVCIDTGCINSATNTGNDKSDHYYCDQHKKFCNAPECIVRTPMSQKYCAIHKDTKPDPDHVATGEPPF